MHYSEVVPVSADFRIIKLYREIRHTRKKENQTQDYANTPDAFNKNCMRLGKTRADNCRKNPIIITS